MSISGMGEPLGGMLVGMLPGAPAGGGVITGVPNGTFDPEDPVDVSPIADEPIGTSPANVNVSPSVVIVVGNVGIGTVSEPITMPDGPITIVEPSASVIVVDVEPMGIVVPSVTIAGAVSEIELELDVEPGGSVCVTTVPDEPVSMTMLDCEEEGDTVVAPVTVLGVCNDGVNATVEGCRIVDISPGMDVVVADEVC